MTGKHVQRFGLFLATFAVLALALGQPQTALAGDVGASDIERLMSTEEGRAALDSAGLSPDRFKAMFAALSPRQQEALVNLARDAAPKARLRARLLAEGYTEAEVNDRLALLTDDEIARLAADPGATEAGSGVGTVLFVICLVLVAVLVAWYFVAAEPVAEPEPPAGD